MLKKTLFMIGFFLVLGIGVLNADSNEPAQPESSVQLDDSQLTDRNATLQCLAAPEVQVTESNDSLVEAVGYECPPWSDYCSRDRDCDQGAGEVCENGCCIAAF